jgi:hypothetical protein
MLGKLIDMPVTNLGSCGASNQKIGYNILTRDIKIDDTIIVVWSHVDGDCMYTLAGIKDIGTWSNDPISKDWTRNCDFYNKISRTLMMVDYVKLHLDRIGCKHYHCRISINDEMDIAIAKHPLYQNLFDIDFSKEQALDFGYDGSHYGIMTHQYIASRINKILK